MQRSTLHCDIPKGMTSRNGFASGECRARWSLFARQGVFFCCRTGSTESRSSGVSISSAALSIGTRTTRSGLRCSNLRAPESPRNSASSRKRERGKMAGTPTVPEYNEATTYSGCRRHAPTNRCRSCAVTATWSASASNTPEQAAGNRATPALIELPIPSRQSLLMTTVAGVCVNNGASSEAWAPNTTIVAAPAISTARDTVVWRRGRPSIRTSCLIAPKRVDAPPASTIA